MTSAVTASGVAFVLRAITSGVDPSVPPLAVPIDVPSKVTSTPLKPISPAPVPWFWIDRRSSAVPPAEKSTVSDPPLKSAESTSTTRALPPCSIATAPSPSV